MDQQCLFSAGGTAVGPDDHVGPHNLLDYEHRYQTAGACFLSVIAP